MALFEARLFQEPKIALPQDDPTSAKVYVTKVRQNGTGPVSYLVRITDFHDPQKAKSCEELARQIMQFSGAEIIHNPYR